MDILLDNPLASMYGPYFLVFYVGFIIALLLISALIKIRIDKTDRLALPPVPQNVDPYEIAYLRGGTNELARSVIFALTRKNAISIKNDGKNATIARNQHDSATLNPIEQITLDWIKEKREIKEIFQKNGLITQLEAFGISYEARLEQRQLLLGDELKSKINRLKMISYALIFGLGIYKIIAAFSHGRTNVTGIFIIGAVGIMLVKVLIKTPRLTKLGKAYIERLQLAFENLKARAQSFHDTPRAHNQAPQNAFAGIDPLLLSVGVFGTGVLAGKLFNDYNLAFQRAQQSAAGSSSCGAGCGTCSSGSSDSSCSSGCSSGCGSGCGGGCGGCS